MFGRSRKEKPLAASQPIAGGSRAGCAPVGFFILFALIGIGVSIPLLILPAVRALLARSWTATPCTILSSQVREHSGSDGSTYSIDITYEYVVSDQRYTSNRYQFLTGSSSGRSGKAAVVARHRPGTRATCYVNPANPAEAVMHRGWTNDYWFALIPLVFVLVGVIGIWGTVRHRTRRALPQAVDWLPPPKTASDGMPLRQAAGPVTLKPEMPRVGKVIGLLLFALVWNGIVSIFIIQAVHSWKRGRPEWGLTLFMIPFAAVGLGVLAALVYQFLGLFNPKVVLKVSSPTADPGGTLGIGWWIEGAAGTLRELRVTLEGSEEAEYQRGTTTHTDRHSFCTVEIARITEPGDMAGKAAISFPPGTIHSFKSKHNRILWRIKVQGKLRLRPRINDAYEIIVRPAAPAKEVPS